MIRGALNAFFKHRIPLSNNLGDTNSSEYRAFVALEATYLAKYLKKNRAGISAFKRELEDLLPIRKLQKPRMSGQMMWEKEDGTVWLKIHDQKPSLDLKSEGDEEHMIVKEKAYQEEERGDTLLLNNKVRPCRMTRYTFLTIFRVGAHGDPVEKSIP